MVKLTEVEDEHFAEKAQATKDDSLLADDDDDYTDTDSDLSSDADADYPTSSSDESLTDRLLALRDIIPPATRGKISSLSSSIYHTTSKGVTYGGKGLWIICTSVLLFGMPYALAVGSEQEMMAEERERAAMAEGASGLIGEGGAGVAEGKAAL